MKLLLPVLALILASTANAFTGIEGGGGKTVVCRNADGSIRSAEILDLYEGRTIYQLKYAESREAWKDQAVRVLERAGIPITQGMPRSTIYDWFLNATENLDFLPAGTQLKPIDDSLEAIIPVGCGLEQTVNYVNDRQILVDTSVWNALSETQRASLMLHEAIYRVLRTNGEKDSRRARHLTAHIVSGGKVEPIFPGNDYLGLCSAANGKPRTTFYVFETPGRPEKLRFQFAFVGGRTMMSAAYLDLDRAFSPDIDLLEQLKHPSQSISFSDQPLTSLFEAGDEIGLGISGAAQGNSGIIVWGTSGFDDSKIDQVEMKCFWQGSSAP